MESLLWWLTLASSSAEIGVVQRDYLFLTQREYDAFERECDSLEREKVLDVVARTRIARAELLHSTAAATSRAEPDTYNSTARVVTTERILVVEVPEQWTTFGHFVKLLSAKRATALQVAAATKRALFFKNCAYSDDHDAIISTEPIKSHGVHLHNCADDYIDFEKLFGLPNRTAVAWPRNIHIPLTRVLQDANASSVVDSQAQAITMTVWTASKLATDFDLIEQRKNQKKVRSYYSCNLFATTRPVGDVWRHLQPTARQIDSVSKILGLHLRTGYADHGEKMDNPQDAVTGRIEKLSQFSVTYPDLLHKSKEMPRGSNKWMDLDFAAFSARRFPGADRALACQQPLFQLLAISQTIECLDSWESNAGIVLATDHATYHNIMVKVVKKSQLLAPARVRYKEPTDTHGHFWHTKSYAKMHESAERMVTGGEIKWHALGIVAAIELHLLTFCDLLIIYGSSIYQRAAQQLAINPNFKLLTLNMRAPGQPDDPTYQLINTSCSRGCYSKLACDCARTSTKVEVQKRGKEYIPH